jgi:hypothetical protein
MTFRLMGVLAAGLVLFGCGEPEEPQTPFNTTMTVHEFMLWYLEPAADVIWDSAGFIVTEEGEIDLQPTTQEGWDHVRNSASIVAEAGNLLMMPGYAADAGDWTDYSSGLVTAALSARAAAVAQDADALFDAGGAVYRVCRACHNRYIIEEGAPE